ncbi:MAG: hypothetical protein L0I29_07100 [Hyphomicrobiales bacterium]|nr:hypothetical protein [Hyphomicrobiales bacterium]
MDAIEKAIRTAFERGNPEDRGYRVKVYRSAFAALERAIASSGDTRSEAADARRKALKLRIVEIEAEYLPAEEGEPVRKPSEPAMAPSVDPDLRNEAGEQVRSPILDDAEPRGADGAFEPRIEPGDRDDVSGPSDPVFPLREDMPRRKGRSGRKGRSLATSALLAIVVLAAIGAGLWWVGNAGLELLSGNPMSGGDNPPKTVEQENFNSSQSAGLRAPGPSTNGEAWITIFSPADPTTVSAPATGKAEVKEEEGGKYLRIQSGSPRSEFVFDVGQGILEQIAGKHAVFDIVAHSEEGKETEMSVNCDLGTLGDCGRKRYHVGHERNDFLFEIDLPDKKPSGAGRLIIDPDLDSKGNPLDIVEIRVSTTP